MLRTVDHSRPIQLPYILVYKSTPFLEVQKSSKIWLLNLLQEYIVFIVFIGQCRGKSCNGNSMWYAVMLTYIGSLVKVVDHNVDQPGESCWPQCWPAWWKLLTTMLTSMVKVVDHNVDQPDESCRPQCWPAWWKFLTTMLTSMVKVVDHSVDQPGESCWPQCWPASWKLLTTVLTRICRPPGFHR